MVINRIESLDAEQNVQPDILVIEDDEQIAHALGRQALEYFDKPVLLARSLFEANAALDEHTPQVVIADMLLGDGDGADLLLRLEADGVPAVAVVTAAPSIHRAATALRARSADFLIKPFTVEQVTAMFDRLARRLSEHEEITRLRRHAETVEAANQQLRIKIDILCKDLVAGYQKLVAHIAR